MTSLSDVDLVLADLEDALAALDAAVSSPKLVRQCFSRFVELTQRLTSARRKEASARTGRSWEAKYFDGWNEITSLFKELRNEEQHSRQIYISVHETRYYELFGPGGGRIAYSGTWQLTDQLAANPPDGMKLFDSDPITGARTNIEIPHCAVGYRYLIQARDDKLAARLKAIGKTELHELSGSCMQILRRYHAFYRTHVDA
jgi:hypothetical protein